MALLVTLLATLPLRAQTVLPMRAVALDAGERIRLDGRLDHPAWQRAPVFDRFVERDPSPGAQPPQPTRVQLLFDAQALYVGITAVDSEPQRIRRPLVRDDQVNRTQDFVVVYVDAIGSRRSAQFFRVNAAGSRGDGIHTAADDSEDFAPDFDWDAAVADHPQGWSAVLRLPFASLRFAEGEQDRWRVMVARRLPRESFHLVLSVPLPREASSFIDRLQPLQGIRLPEKHAFLTLRPSLTLRREVGDQPRVASLLSNLAIVARRQGNLLDARRLHEESLSIRRSFGDRWAIGVSLNNLGNVLLDLGSYDEAVPCFEEALTLMRQVGDRWTIANFLNNLGNAARAQADYARAQALYRESLLIYRGFGDKWALAYLLEDIGSLLALEGKPYRALRLVGAATALRATIGVPLSGAEQARLDGLLAPALHPLDGQERAAALAEGQALAQADAISEALEQL